MNPLAKNLLRLLLGLVIASSSWAAEKQLRIATLAPKNSLYHRRLIELGEAWRAAQGGEGKFVVYPDGSQGGETDMARRMRIGQLQGGLLSVVGLREIEPSIAALQSLPMLFKSWEEIDYVREKMRAGIEQKFLAKGFVVLAWGDAGWVRFFSTTAAVRPGDYKKMKFFAWAGESEQQEIMKSLGYTPVPLETSDILPAIQTGMITAVPSTPYFALASQIYSTAPHMLDLNWAPIVGALIITKKSWDEMNPATQEAMKKRGLTVNQPNPQQLEEWQQLANQLYPRIRGKMVPADTFDEVFAHLKNYRAGKR